MEKKLRHFFIPLALLTLLLFFPKFISTPLGKPILIRTLEKRLHGKVTIKRVELSWFGPQRLENISFCSPEVQGNIKEIESHIPLWSLSDLAGALRLENGSFSFPLYGGEQITQVYARIKGSDIDVTGSTPQGGHLSLKGKVYAEDDFHLIVDLKDAPVGVLDQLCQAKGMLYQVLGSIFDLTGTIVYNQGDGDAILNFFSPNAKTAMNAVFFEHSLTLKEPFDVILHLTKELSLMHDVNPLFFTDIEMKNPAALHISSKNFHFPFDPFTIDKLRIGHAVLDIGQIRAKIGKSLHALLNLLKSPQTGEEVDIWFTPVVMRMENGLIETGRMDALFAHSIHICIWGTIDLSKNQIKMCLGLPADTLAQSFGIKNLPRNYVLEIPIRGSIKDPQLDTKAASAKIAALLAAQQVPKLKGKKGKFFGGFLNLFSQAKEEGIPPANRPFPWEGSELK